ncbi:MAG: hypothetical protein JWP87_2699 [Labilithrix sp.]|nr:hypothetical protein [Labilithrix sp.]
MKLTRAVIGSMVIVGCWEIPARADDSAHDKAVASFQEGRKYIEAGNCDAAVTKLRESLSYEPSVGARLSLAECQEPTDPLSAWRVLKEAASLAFLNHDDRLSLAETRAAAIEKRLPTIKVNIPQSTVDQPGFELRVDGELIDKFHYRSGVIATKPGKHVVEASAPLRHWSQQIVADPGASAQVNVQLERDTCSTGGGAAAATVAPVAVTRENPGSTRRTLGLAIAGVGIAGLASGVVFGIVTLNKKSKIEDLCGGNAGNCNAPPGSVDPEREAATTSATISTASFIAGGVALVGGGLLYFTAPNATPASSTARVRLAPRVGTNGGGMGLEGTW